MEIINPLETGHAFPPSQSMCNAQSLYSSQLIIGSATGDCFSRAANRLFMEVNYMKACEIPSAEMFSKAMHVNLDKADLAFEGTRRAAFETARTHRTEVPKVAQCKGLTAW